MKNNFQVLFFVFILAVSLCTAGTCNYYAPIQTAKSEKKPTQKHIEVVKHVQIQPVSVSFIQTVFTKFLFETPVLSLYSQLSIVKITNINLIKPIFKVLFTKIAPCNAP